MIACDLQFVRLIKFVKRFLRTMAVGGSLAGQGLGRSCEVRL